MTDKPSLSGAEIRRWSMQSLDEVQRLRVLEQYAMFMGKAQILEFGLKGLLTRKYGVPFEDMEKWTLEVTKNELRNRGSGVTSGCLAVRYFTKAKVDGLSCCN